MRLAETVPSDATPPFVGFPAAVAGAAEDPGVAPLAVEDWLFAWIIFKRHWRRRGTGRFRHLLIVLLIFFGQGDLKYFIVRINS